jgi:hypothetical protein
MRMGMKRLLMSAGAAALILAGVSGAEAGGRGHEMGVRGLPAHAHGHGANFAHASQKGKRNASVIGQTGSGNIARTMQHGDDNQAVIGQSGDNNRGKIIQVGDGLDASLLQEGGERSKIIQVNRGNASVDILTGPGGRRR